jgi:hypothetical protein
MSVLVNDTTIQAIASTTQADVFAFILVIVLLVFLIWKEIVGATQAGWARRLSRALDVVLAPCGLGFLFVAFVKILALLG